jgi:hypothetical protein
MTLKDIREEAKSYGLEIEETATDYVIKQNGRELQRVPKSAGLAKLTDALANCAS